MKISVFGLGYVGAVTLAFLSRDGHDVTGVDANPVKAAIINSGESPIVEPGLTELLREGVKSGKIRATTDFEDAVFGTEITLISVGTPPAAKGQPDLSFVSNVCRQIAAAIVKKGEPHLVVLRSTVPPGTLRLCLKLMEDLAGKGMVQVAFNPEFLWEGTALRDYDLPPYTILGTEHPDAEFKLRKLYADVHAPVLVVKPEVAEMVKYVANTWHAAKFNAALQSARPGLFVLDLAGIYKEAPGGVEYHGIA